MAHLELEIWKKEMRKRPEIKSVPTPDQTNARNKKNRTIRHGYRTRATIGEDPEEDDESEVNKKTNLLILIQFFLVDTNIPKFYFYLKFLLLQMNFRRHINMSYVFSVNIAWI